MAVISVPMKGTPARKAVPMPGKAPSFAPTGAAPKPNPLKNTRDYGKPAPAAPMGPPPSPFGPADGSSQLGGI